MIEIDDTAVVTTGSSGYGPGEAPEWDYYSKCIHCGLCLNACPTYRELGLEMDSPRGRIYQIIQVDRGRLPLGESFVRHIDSCLDCRACETACPSGVEYGRLVEAARSQICQYYQRPGIGRYISHIFFQKLLPDRRMLNQVGTLLWLFQKSGLEAILVKSGIPRLLSKRLGRVAALSPQMEKPFFTKRLGQVVKPVGDLRYRVAFFAGCIANLAFARLNDATVRVLARNGCEVVIPEAQGCCGALHVHAGIRGKARELAKQNIRTFLDGGFDYFITNAAGCGSVLKEYPLLFEHEEHEFYEQAQEFSSRVRDVTEFLAGIEFDRNFGAIRARATYQDPCHLGHAQHIRSAPRTLMAAIPGLELVELKESEVCCGSAGIYNVVQNEMADRLLTAKMQRVDETGAELVLTANPGCLLQLRAGVARSRLKRRVLHVVELLDEAYRSRVQAG
ncbi:MAG: 4Fe-4S dicluster domain-containing protein [Acidobacteria bacterium]|nr:MAG: 4Fe-4S dicluster domain-containing protein [Acidobacteriota bacterium]